MDNKKSYIAAAMIVALAAVAGLSYFSYAQVNSDASSAGTEIGTSRRSGFGRGMMGMNLTEEERAQWESEREERMKEMDARHEAVKKALDNGDYEAWKTAVGSDSPMLEKINVGNFSKLAEAHKLQEQARAIMDDLDIDSPGMGMGMGMGMGKGGFKGGCGMHGMQTGTTGESSGSSIQ